MHPAFAAALSSLPRYGAGAARSARTLRPICCPPTEQVYQRYQRYQRHVKNVQPGIITRACATSTNAAPAGTRSTVPNASAPEQDPQSSTPPPGKKPLRLLWDSECPLCVMEVEGLKRRAAAFATSPVDFVDVAELGYEASEENGGVSYEVAMGRIHAVTGDGDVISGVEVFRRVYEELGMGWVYAPTKLPVVGTVVDRAYDVWADNRLRLTGRPTLDELVELREKARQKRESGDGTCR